MSARITTNLAVTREHFLCHVVGAKSCDLALEPILRKWDVDLADDAVARISYDKLMGVRLDICRALDDETEGFSERRAPWGSTVLMCRALISSLNLRDALLRYKKYNAILNDEVKIDVREDGDDASVDLRFANLKRIDNRADIQNRIYFLVSFLVWLTAGKFTARRIWFEFPMPAFAADFHHVIPCQYTFDQPINRLIFDQSLMREAVRQSPRSLNAFLSNHLFHLINRSLTSGTLSQRIRRLLAANLSATSTVSSVSEFFGIAETTLRRHLHEEGTSFGAIKDEIRKERALHFLLEQKLTVAETAARTGFSDATAFSRAFKEWTGYAPQHYREKQS